MTTEVDEHGRQLTGPQYQTLYGVLSAKPDQATARTSILPPPLPPTTPPIAPLPPQRVGHDGAGPMNR